MLFLRNLFLAAWIATRAFGSATKAVEPIRPLERGVKTESVSFDDNTPIRVLLTRRAAKIRISGAALLRAPNQTVHTPSGAELHFVRRGDRIVGFFGKVGVRGGEKIFRPPLTIQGMLLLEGAAYRGQLHIELDGRGLSVVNILKLSDYLAGTVGSEMPASWPRDALRAQTVAARSYALAQIAARKTSRYDVESTVQDQVYRGRQLEASRVQNAISDTHGEYLSLGHRPALAHYHSRCGGFGETPETVWGDNHQPKQPPIRCEYCQNHRYLWTTRVNRQELARLLSLRFNVETPLKIWASARTAGGRLKALLFSQQNYTQKIDAEKLRRLVGYSRLQSTRFRWATEGNDFVFEGAGAGHGVGLCQWGAQSLARRGWNYRKILEHYYPRHRVLPLGGGELTSRAKNRSKASATMVDGRREPRPSRARLSSPSREHRKTSHRTAG